MKAVALFICLVGPVFAISTHPVNHKLRTHRQKTPEKSEYIHPEASKEENTGYVDEDDLLPTPRNLKPGSEDRDGPQTMRKQERTGSKHQVKNSLKSIDFLALHNKLGLVSDTQDSDSGSSGREQSSSEHDQLRNHEKHGNTANQHLPGHTEHPVGAFSLEHEHNMWKYNKNAVGLSEKNSENDDEESMEEEDEKWGEETDYRDTKHKDHQTHQGDQYKRQEHENSMQLDDELRDSRQLTWKTKRHSKKFDLEEEERENRKKSYEEEIPLSQKTHNEYQDGKQQSQERNYHIQVNYQSDHDTVGKTQDREDSNDDDSHDSGGEEYLSNTWKDTAYEEEERIQSNDQESTSTEPGGEGTIEDDTAVHRETEDYQVVKIKDLAHSEQDYYAHEPPNSDNKQQLKMSSSIQNMNSMDSEDKVKTTDSSHGEMESASSRNEEALIGLPDTCRNFHCKRGKVCHADKQGKPHCICQDPAACPPTKDYEHVCGTDNKTYDGTCQLFGTKCQLEGTKIGRQLHLDYMGSCKYIPPCTDYEVDQFPLRMRDWLKNILIQFYERDLNTSGILTEKQRNKVKKIYQNDKRLGAGDHPVELLLHDFEKNYHMYVYPVHWQFHQLDQHPVDRLLTHSELAPLRASLVPMEHCITRFFQECDGDKNKLIALKEWCHCFGIKEGKPKRIGRCT
ncbi:SPARC-like protein 1 isoform X1 [Melospiza georgiana]|uniref:SPARC-like protein 1 isoform X1 n=1 Tax=Melospiza georgiana TaxID=44398 RepID=UPI0025AC1EC3|nr:SPARC-like protein 1 isoform X1 [Melospiza georgiana]